MIGNVWEWTENVYRENPFGGDVLSEGPTSRKARVVRGGSWDDGPRDLRVSVRGVDPPANRGDYLGFRCARDGSP